MGVFSRAESAACSRCLFITTSSSVVGRGPTVIIRFGCWVYWYALALAIFIGGFTAVVGD